MHVHRRSKNGHPTGLIWKWLVCPGSYHAQWGEGTYTAIFVDLFMIFSGLGTLSVRMSIPVRLERYNRELLGWSEARVMKVFLSFVYQTPIRFGFIQPWDAVKGVATRFGSNFSSRDILKCVET